MQIDPRTTIAPDRPRAVDDHVVACEQTGDTVEWTAVCVEAAAETTAVDDDPGVADETIADVDWFDGLPAATHNREWTESTYRRCDRAAAPE